MWWEFGVALIAAFAIVAGPGALLIAAVGLRGRWLVGLAIPAGMTVIGVAAIVGGLFGLAWSAVVVIGVAVALTALIIVLRLLLWRRSGLFFGTPAERPRWYAVGVGTAVLVILIQLFVVIGSPDNISQTFDNIFHLNAIRYALNTQDASPLWLGTMTNPSGALAFYPSGWHAVGSLVVQLTGTTIPIASNAIMTMFAAIAWPASIVLFASVIAPLRGAGLVAAGAVAAGIGSFPLLVIEYGALFPFMAALSLVPAAAAVAATALRKIDAPPAALWITFLGVLPGIVVTHPGAFVALIVVVTVILAVVAVGSWRANESKQWRLVLGGLGAGYIVIVGAAWYVLRPEAAARTWLTEGTIAQAVGEVAFVAVNRAPVNIVVAILVIVGLVACFRAKKPYAYALMGLFVVLAGLYVAAVGLPYWTLRDILVGAWYNNIPRLAALMPIVWVPLAAIGAQRIAVYVQERRAAGTFRALTPAVAAAAFIVAIVAVPQLSQMREAVAAAKYKFTYTDDSSLLTIDERDLLLALPDLVPADARVAGSSWTGAGLAYAFANREVVMPHTLMELSPDAKLILDGLDDATAGSKVCDAVNRLHVGYVLDFGDQEINNSHNPMPGLEDLARSHAVELVEKRGDAALYRVTACS